MVAERITSEDIRAIGVGGKLIVTLPSFHAVVSARNMVSYVRRAYPREDGCYKTTYDPKTFTLTVMVVPQED